MSLYTRVGNVINYSDHSSNDSRPVVYSLIGPGDRLLSITTSGGSVLSSDSASVGFDRDVVGSATYDIVSSFRPQENYQFLTQANERDVRNVTDVYDCSVDLSYWYYRDVDFGASGEEGEARHVASLFPSECWDQPLNFSANHPMVVAFLNADTAEQYLVMLYDPEDPTLPDAPGVNYRANAPVVLRSQVANAVPPGTPLVMFYGVLCLLESGDVLMDPTNPFATGTCKSLHRVRTSTAVVENIHPSHAWNASPVRVEEVAGEDSLRVTLDIASAAQVSGYAVRAVRDQPGRFDQPVGSVVFADTVFVPSRFHAPDGYQTTSTHTITDLRAGEQVTVSVTPLVRGLYTDTEALEANRVEMPYVLQTSTPTDTTPAAVALAVAVQPNPVRDRATLRLNSATAGAVQIRVLDTLGRMVSLAHQSVQPGESKVALDLGGVAGGVYVVQVRLGEVQATQTLTVVR